ncbi:hypothetical protein SH661x_004360 [Planctomicrobium sp. SH661]|uniref:hypothetical protein n=1 Tax=Planctomicrobium sp. SH661 TaxID=3448124 RepID=UPI003F5BD4AA
MASQISHDAFLWYNVGDWAKYGLAVPNWSDDSHSQNDTIRYLVSVMGRNLQNILWHTDARLTVPPSINTLTRIHKLCTRARSILFSRSVASGTPNMEPIHALPAAEEFLLYPTPYFRVRNQWLKQYCGLVLLAQTEAIQHQENARPLEISEAFSGLIGQYIQRVYRLMAVELFRVPLEQASAGDFTLSEAQLAAYNPSAWFTSTEMIDTVPSLQDWPTEDQLKVLTNGIPISQLPQLPRWPSSPQAGVTGTTATPAGSGESFAPSPTV